MNTTVDAAYSNVRKLRTPLTVLIWITGILGPVSLVVNLIERNALKVVIGANNQLTDDMLAAVDASDRNQLIIGLVILAVFIVSTVVWLMWIFRNNKLARALGASSMTYTPGWSVGWFFIPIAHFFKPYFAMKEIYLATIDSKSFSANQEVEDNPEALYFLRLWWLVYLVNNFLSWTAGRLRWQAATLEAFMSANSLSIAADIGVIVASLTTIRLIREFTRRQDIAVTLQREESASLLDPQTTSV